MVTEKRRLKQLTQRLRELNEQAYRQFEERTCKDGYEVDFYGEVKPFADEVQILADEWKPLAVKWAIEEKPKYVYPIQINDTYENMTIAAVQAFQTDTKHKRFTSMTKSIEYILESIEIQL
ncbi:YppE family protein [Pseudalkalibacillus salsuginis]|uniref:YppE family protein n=1 Tax=Pseudalkalibacillus salsuginis TaxID=2910972 RepID=UPI001F294ED9|nr:YppE family protein [Pseudalkalibacillus salsuginis]MCF6408191.1 YppE family protein [Pseudalkalibacillus salsuginis]